YFTINELYKGSVEQHLKVDFDCSTACMMSFSKNDEWLIYAIFQRFDLITVSICEHSRKNFSDSSQDIYQLNSGRTFAQEKQFLNTALNIQPFAKNNELNSQQNELGPHNDQPSATNKLWLLLTSILVMAIVYYLTRYKKQNGK
ncbi:MAG: hypothetical protein H0W84_13005, partial [Bacteroidetes bacterium]|nr:hypothetical protein [Bacteroidota bacterium]